MSTSAPEAVSEQAEPGIVHLGSATDFTFPVAAADAGLDGLAAAHDRLRERSRASTKWVDGDRVPAEVRHALRFGGAGPISVEDVLRFGALSVDQAVVIDDGRDDPRHRADATETPHRRLLPAVLVEMLRAVDGEGGFAVTHVEQFDDSMRQLHHALAAARHHQVELLLTVGSVVTAKYLRPATSTSVCTLEGTAVVRSDDLPPTSLGEGEVIRTDRPARITAGAGTVCLVIASYGPQAYDERKFLLRRATCHPLLRLDAPIHPADHQDLYGVGDGRRYVEVVQDELARLADVVDRPAFDAWWCSRLLSPVPSKMLRGDATHARGSLPGGFGVVARDPEKAILTAGRQNLMLREGLLPLLEPFVDGALVALDAHPEVPDVVAVLAAAGLVEVFAGEPGDDGAA
jgi:hypothetical protein